MTATRRYCAQNRDRAAPVNDCFRARLPCFPDDLVRSIWPVRRAVGATIAVCGELPLQRSLRTAKDWWLGVAPLLMLKGGECTPGEVPTHDGLGLAY
jgi:hypothetical protein